MVSGAKVSPQAATRIGVSARFSKRRPGLNQDYEAQLLKLPICSSSGSMVGGASTRRALKREMAPSVLQFCSPSNLALQIRSPSLSHCKDNKF